MTDGEALWEVHVLEFARSKDQLVAGLILGAHDAGVVDLPFSFVLARRDDRVVRVDQRSGSVTSSLTESVVRAVLPRPRRRPIASATTAARSAAATRAPSA